MKVTQLNPAWFTHEGITEGDGAPYWADIEKYLEKACKHCEDRLTADLLRELVASRQGQMWIAFDPASDEIRAAAVTKLTLFPNGHKSAEIVALGGEGKNDWLGLLPVMERWAVNEGCTHLMFQGRKSWARVLKDFAVLSYNFEKDLR